MHRRRGPRRQLVARGKSAERIVPCSEPLNLKARPELMNCCTLALLSAS